jgi:hypothetical protein
VIVDIVTTEGEQAVLENMQRKAKAADKLFSSVIGQMQNALRLERGREFTKKEIIPDWMRA